MNSFKKQEKALLMSICSKENISFGLAEKLLKSAEDFAYNNVTKSTRSKEYEDLIKFYFNKKSG